MASGVNEKQDGRFPSIMEERDKISVPGPENDEAIQANSTSYDVGNEKGNVIQHAEHNISKDGMRLHPQPTADPLDPLNWSSFRKHSILAIVMYLYAFVPITHLSNISFVRKWSLWIFLDKILIFVPCYVKI